MKIQSLALCIGLLILMGSYAAASDECPAGTDKSYCALAKSTGGKILRESESLPEISVPKAVKSEVVRHNSIFSRQLGCEYQAQGADRNLCLLFENKQEWSWLGHGGPFPGWRVSFTTICEVYYKYEISEADLPQLERMRKVNHGDIDWRLQTGLDGLIRILNHTNGSQVEDAASIFNPENPDYILKKNCRK
jgi:hypothetical protein